MKTSGQLVRVAFGKEVHTTYKIGTLRATCVPCDLYRCVKMIYINRYLYPARKCIVENENSFSTRLRREGHRNFD